MMRFISLQKNGRWRLEKDISPARDILCRSYVTPSGCSRQRFAPRISKCHRQHFTERHSWGCQGRIFNNKLTCRNRKNLRSHTVIRNDARLKQKEEGGRRSFHAWRGPWVYCDNPRISCQNMQELWGQMLKTDIPIFYLKLYQKVSSHIFALN